MYVYCSKTDIILMYYDLQCTYTYVCVCPIDIKKVDKQLHVVYGTFRYGRCSRNPLSGPLLFIYNNMYLSYIY